jgi:hypothetical protein
VHEELQNIGDRQQTELHQVNITAHFLRFTILSGYAEFATVNRQATLLRYAPSSALQKAQHSVILTVFRVSVVGEPFSEDTAKPDSQVPGQRLPDKALNNEDKYDDTM